LTRDDVIQLSSNGPDGILISNWFEKFVGVKADLSLTRGGDHLRYHPSTSMKRKASQTRSDGGGEEITERRKVGSAARRPKKKKKKKEKLLPRKSEGENNKKEKREPRMRAARIKRGRDAFSP